MPSTETYYASLSSLLEYLLTKPTEVLTELAGVKNTFGFIEWRLRRGRKDWHKPSVVSQPLSVASPGVTAVYLPINAIEIVRHAYRISGRSDGKLHVVEGRFTEAWVSKGHEHGATRLDHGFGAHPDYKAAVNLLHQVMVELGKAPPRRSHLDPKPEEGK